MRTKMPPFTLWMSFLSAWAGGLIRMLLGWHNGHELEWLGIMAKAWLESRLELLRAGNKTAEDRYPVGAGQ